ncbi:nitrate ABC transporter substrate-binding protein [Corticibacter populi]|uniref:Nitrate ABC transporter substrate-binding protein n=1 Tax=Corticibacter populi TaxID=1550736 RepID=A0A3M6QRG4_9BURK|nr:CmpA/NrtA family ABC transporter substrate-binding protein [Corticibacter populi]RMX05634.1 nitrate ABC transporter substrate-binding protein [Corticibacter populi]RZS31091.1 nitrate/nitrite transport system substrate-binding protein [Corticibacter populi]
MKTFRFPSRPAEPASSSTSISAGSPTSTTDPYDADRPLSLRCACGQDHAPQVHAAALARDTEALYRHRLEAAVIKAMFPADAMRRRFLKAVGAGTARAAIASVLPLSALQAMAQEKAPLEKKNLKIGFIPITCATPVIMADPLGMYADQGLAVEVIKTANWALIRDKMINGEHDASQFLSPMPLAMTMGVGSAQTPIEVAAIQNTNGQAITLANKHKNNRDPKNWKGMRFAVPFDYSMHNFLLRYYVAEAGLNPDTDIQIRVVPPPEMVANLRAGNIDGYLGPDPFNQRAVYEEVGFIHLLTKELWDGHPCCAFGSSAAFIQNHPNTFAALSRAILTAATMARKPENRAMIAKAIAPAQYLNQPETVVTQVLTGRYADGLGSIQNVPDRADFDPVPWQSMAVWILTQMQRWGYVQGEVNYQQIAERVFRLTDARRLMRELGENVPDGNDPGFTIMGKAFDPSQPQQYLQSFAIRKAA